MPPPRGCGRAGTEAAEFAVDEMKIGKFRGHQAEVNRIACERLIEAYNESAKPFVPGKHRVAGVIE